MKIKKSDIKAGYFLAPFINKIVKTPSKKYVSYMKKYNKAHEVCPKCGAKGYSSTLMGYIFDCDHPEQYKDLNNCICSNCRDHHTMHERISEEEFLKKSG